MLTLLHIENIAVIERAEISFGTGFHVLTGETGAGKSIIIDALSAVLGHRVSRELIRTGATKASVGAVFSNLRPEFIVRAAALGFEPEEDGTFFIQRDLYADGKNACRVNARPAALSVLRELGALLVNIHGQHDGQQLMDETLHLSFLDDFAGEETGPLKERYRAEYDALRATEAEIAALSFDEKEKQRRLETLRFQIDELRAANLRPGEEEELSGRRTMLRNAARITSAVETAYVRLYGDDESGGAVSALADAANALSGAKGLTEELHAVYQKAEEQRYALLDLTEEVRAIRDSLAFSEDELDQIESRLDALYRLKRKYGASAEEMLSYLAEIETEYARIGDSSDRLEQLAACRTAQYRAACETALALSRVRETQGKALCSRIMHELEALDMKRCTFVIPVERQAEQNGDLILGPDGADRVTFLLSANAGEPPKALSRVASGGEISRVMLAIKNVLAENDIVDTLVFDEVDTGVSGRAAQKVAEKLYSVSRNRQVLCVTHLPQIAAMADMHMLILKGEHGGRTYTEVRVLDSAGRAEELARIMAGQNITQTTIESAKELIDASARYKSGGQ